MTDKQLKTMETVLEHIAQHEGIETLETRRSDGLDFHDISVERLKRMLTAAYRAGQESAKK